MQRYCDVYKWTILKRTSPEVKCLHPTSSRREMCTLSVSNVIYHKFSHGAAFYTLNGKNVNVMLESGILRQGYGIICCFIGHHQLANLIRIRYPSSRLRNHMLFHWSPSTSKPHLTPVSFVKATESYAVSLVTINWQTSLESGILRQGYGIICCFIGHHQSANLI